jgi:ABC-2 type transport system ATP-binding protein
MNKGKIVLRGTPQELISRHGGGTTIVLAGAGAKGHEALAARGIPATGENGNVLVHVASPGEVRRMLATVAAVDIEVTEIYTKRATLEDVFLKVIGARMAEGELAA